MKIDGLANGAAAYMEGWRAGWEPDPIQTVSEWSDEFRILGRGETSEPGPFRTSRVPFLREIADVLSSTHPARRVVVMKGTQLALTTMITNFLGYIIHRSPGPILYVQPTIEDARKESKHRVSPMIENTPILRGLVSEARERDSGNTILMKEFPGGVLVMGGANSPRGLRRMPARYVLMDEVDGYPGDVGEEGDPVSLAERRASNFPQRKILLTSSPTIKGISRIEKEFLASDQRRYFVPCPFCGNMDWIRWENIRFDKRNLARAQLLCTECQELIDERHKTRMLAAGEWRPTNESNTGTLGYHLSSLYSPLGWFSWTEAAADWIKKEEHPNDLKTFINTILGEPWEERGETVDAESLAARLEDREPGQVPAGAGILVAAVDVQGDRLEGAVLAFGAMEESWLIAYTQIHGDPATNAPWFELDQFLGQEFTHESGQTVRVSCTAVDSGGHHTEQVYKYCRARVARRIFAVKGGSERSKPVVPARPSIRNPYRAKLFTLCVDTAKEVIYSRLKVQTKGPGYVHLPLWIDPEFLEQLTAEKAIWKWVKGKGMVRNWIKLRERNEALDLYVYALAALYILGQATVRSLPERAKAWAVSVEGEKAEEGAQKAPARPPRLRRRGGWMGRIKG